MYKEKLIKLLRNSYAPYSNYKVAAIVAMKDGNEFSGVNVDNASYGLSICAERVAIFNAVTSGYKKGDFKSLYLMSDTGKGSPCGACRQVMWEFKIENIYVYNGKDFDLYELSELLPNSFDEEDMK